MIDWYSKIQRPGKRLLKTLGYDNCPGNINPITDALAKTPDEFLETINAIWPDKKYLAAVTRTAIACQMAVYDNNGGPEGDRQRKGLRRHWYHWFKTKFAQPFGKLTDSYDQNSAGDDLKWSGRMSQQYAYFVDRRDVTYWDMWVKDASRMIRGFETQLVDVVDIIIAVEKDSLFEDFIAPAEALGATALISGKGKNSKAAAEKMLYDVVGWRPEADRPLGYRDPLIRPLVILHISDHDFDGESVIGPTFAEQLRRYSDRVYEARVGIFPESVENQRDEWYVVKTHNQGYRSWAETNALYEYECPDCFAQFPAQGLDSDPECAFCGNIAAPIYDEDGNATPHGFEVESIPTRNYYGMLVDALLRVLPFHALVKYLRKECQADPMEAAWHILREILEGNSDYQDVLAEQERLTTIKENFENDVATTFVALGSPHTGLWEDLEEDPEPAEFRKHVAGTTGGRAAWRPFSQRLRSEKLAEYLREKEEETIENFKNQKISW